MFKNNKKLHRLTIGMMVLALLVCLCFTFASAAEKAHAPARETAVAATEATEATEATQKGAQSNGEALENFADQTGIMMLIKQADWKSVIMILISFVLMYLAIGRGFEPLLLLPIAFGMLLTNLPGAGMYHSDIFAGGHVNWAAFSDSKNFGLIDVLYLGVKLGVYPCLIFIGVGASTDFGPLIANPKTLLLGAAAQLGIFLAFLGAKLLGFTPYEAGSIGIIGGADGPTAIYTTSLLAPNLLGAIAIAAYSYMALVPLIQPPIMRLLTTKKERAVVMEQLRPVSKKEKIIFPIMVTVVVSLILPSAAVLVGMLMLGNLMRESGVVDRLSKTAQNEMMNIIVIFLGLSVGATTNGASFLTPATLKVVALGLFAFATGTAFGVLFGKLMYIFTGGKVNPLIGSAVAAGVLLSVCPTL